MRILIASFLIAFLLGHAGSVLAQDEKQMWDIVMETPQEEGLLAKQLRRLIELYQVQNDGDLPQSFAELNQRYPEQQESLVTRFGSNYEEQYVFISQHQPIEAAKNWKLLLISSSAIPLESRGELGRYLVYTDEGQLKQIGETEEWFAKYVGNAIPGITFGENATNEVPEEPTAEIPVISLAPEVAEVAKESAASEPASVKPVKVAPATEPSSESLEQSSNCWLWIIGAVVVIGGLGLALRRKS